MGLRCFKSLDCSIGLQFLLKKAMNAGNLQVMMQLFGLKTLGVILFNRGHPRGSDAGNALEYLLIDAGYFLMTFIYNYLETKIIFGLEKVEEKRKPNQINLEKPL